MLCQSAEGILVNNCLLYIRRGKLREIKGIERIDEVDLLHDRDTIILGAFGCGAFQNNPEIVACAAKSVVGDYLYAFRNIEFAVYCPPRDDRNYRIFERLFGKLGKLS